MAAAEDTSANQGTTRVNRSQAPKRLGRFQILERVGAGGFGAVYRAQDPQLHRMVALKLLQSTGDERRDRHRINRFLIEGRAGARLQHPNIVPVFDAGRDQETGEYYMAAAFIPGEPLSAAIDGIPLELKRAATIVMQLAQALDYAHKQGILHRDVKPDNVMLDEQDVPHLMDFGLARMEESESHLTKDGAVMGTPSYMSPEQCVGNMEVVGPAADQYSLGCLMYELLTGEKLFDGPVSIQIHHQINTDAPAPSRKNKRVPEDLDTICLKSLSKEPEQRYSSCSALSADLGRWLADEPIRARQLTKWERWNRWRRRNPAIAGLSMGLAAALVIGVVGVTTQWIRAENQTRTALLAVAEQEKATAEQEKATQLAESERRATQRHLADSYAQRGRFSCEQGQLADGLLWMARGLRTLPGDEAEAARLISLEIGAWEPLLPRREQVVLHQEREPVTEVRFGPDGTWFVTGGRDHIARIWETSTGRPLSPPLSHDGAVLTIDISADGNRLLTGSAGGTLRQWRIPGGEVIGEPIHQAGAVGGAAYIDGGGIVARSSEKILAFWNAETGQPLREPITLKANQGKVAVTSDRRTIVVQDWNELLKFDAAGNESGARIPTSMEQARGFAVSPDGKLLLAGGLVAVSRRGTLRAWDISRWESVQSQLDGPWSAINDVAYSPDGKWIVTGLLNGRVERRAAKDLQRTGQSWQGPTAIRSIASHPTSHLILTGSDDGAAVVWSAPEPTPYRLEVVHPQGAYGVQFTPDGRRIVSVGNDGTARVWDAETGAAIGQPVPHPGHIWYAAVSPDGRLGASGGGASALLWNIEDGAVVGAPLAHPAVVMGVDFTRDGRLLLTGCEDGIARLWDVTTQQVVAQTAKLPDKIWPVDVSDDGTRFVTVSGQDVGNTYGDIRVWDVRTCELLAGPIRYPAMMTSAKFANRNQWLITAAEDGTAQVWDIATAQVVRGPFRHPSHAVVAICDPTERVLVTSCGDGRVRFWDLQTQRRFGADLVHDDMAVGLSFAPDGKRLATGSLDGTVRVWDVAEPASGTPTEIEQRIERATGMRLSEQGDVEWAPASSWKSTPQDAAPD